MTIFFPFSLYKIIKPGYGQNKVFERRVVLRKKIMENPLTTRKLYIS